MPIGKFLGGIGALIWDEHSKKYLFLRRSNQRDFKADTWECVTGRVDQGESYEEALHREVMEEIQAHVWIDFIIGTTHFHRGEQIPENELLGVIYGCTIKDASQVHFSNEHSEMRWVTLEEALEILPDTDWLRKSIIQAEELRSQLPVKLLRQFRQQGFEI